MRPTVLFDATCGFCQWGVRKILAWDRAGLIRAVPLQDPEADILLTGMDANVRADSWHFISEDGRIHSAGRAIAPLLSILPYGKAPAALCSSLPVVPDLMYRLVATHRARIGRWVGAPTCSNEARR
ncbi:MAG: hypothetical protein QOJ31_393 [Gaiellales bacterium]|nr:hypothetical protein [Gaiellales bacterium]